MAHMFVGYFAPDISKVDLERDLTSHHFSNEDYVIYVKNQTDKLLVSLNIDNEAKNEAAIEILKKYLVEKTFKFENISGPMDYQELKKIIELNAKSEVRNIDVLHYRTASEGINDEVAF